MEDYRVTPRPRQSPRRRWFEHEHASLEATGGHHSLPPPMQRTAAEEARSRRRIGEGGPRAKKSRRQSRAISIDGLVEVRDGSNSYLQEQSRFRGTDTRLLSMSWPEAASAEIRCSAHPMGGMSPQSLMVLAVMLRTARLSWPNRPVAGSASPTSRSRWAAFAII